MLSNELRGFPTIYSIGPYLENNLILYHPVIKQFDTIENMLFDLGNVNFIASKKVDSFPRIGVGVIALNNKNQILLGKRKNSHGDGNWAPPGGHLEFGESPIQCAKRELLEETGLSLLSARESSVTNDVFTKDDKHYLTVFVEGNVEGEALILEPDKCTEWRWFDWDNLPSPLFLPFTNLLQKKELRILS